MGYSRGGSLLPSRSADVRAPDDAIAFGRYRELADNFVAYAGEFEQLAVGVVHQCEMDNSRKTRDMLRLPLENFRIMRYLKPGFKFDPISLAVDTDKLDFLAYPAVTAENQESWYGPIDNRTYMIMHIINLLCPYDFIFDEAYKSPYRIQLTAEAEAELETRAAEAWASSRVGLGHKPEDGKDGKDGKDGMPMQHRPSRYDRMKIFYKAPLSKFYFGVMYMLGYAAMAITVTLGPLHGVMSEFEFILMAWNAAAIIEAIHEMILIGAKYWVVLHWNILEILIHVVYGIAIILRLTNSTAPGYLITGMSEMTQLRWTKVAFAFVSALAMWRIIRLYYLSETVSVHHSACNAHPQQPACLTFALEGTDMK